MHRHRKTRDFKFPSMAYSRPARKPRSLQWKVPACGRHLSLFTCGLCHRQYSRRDNLHRHKKKCYSDPARLNGLINECKLRTNYDPRLASRPLFPPKRGRPKLASHKCKICSKMLPSAQKKRDHQRCCKPFVIIQPDRDVGSSPNLGELIKSSA